MFLLKGKHSFEIKFLQESVILIKDVGFPWEIHFLALSSIYKEKERDIGVSVPHKELLNQLKAFIENQTWA
jgi:hypothetical protein